MPRGWLLKEASEVKNTANFVLLIRERKSFPVKWVICFFQPAQVFIKYLLLLIYYVHTVRLFSFSLNVKLTFLQQSSLYACLTACLEEQKVF